VLVHFAHERPDLGPGELADALLQELFVFGQLGQGECRIGNRGRHAADVIIGVIAIW